MVISTQELFGAHFNRHLDAALVKCTDSTYKKRITDFRNKAYTVYAELGPDTVLHLLTEFIQHVFQPSTNKEMHDLMVATFKELVKEVKHLEQEDWYQHELRLLLGAVEDEKQLSHYLDAHHAKKDAPRRRTRNTHHRMDQLRNEFKKHAAQYVLLLFIPILAAFFIVTVIYGQQEIVEKQAEDIVTDLQFEEIADVVEIPPPTYKEVPVRFSFYSIYNDMETHHRQSTVVQGTYSYKALDDRGSQLFIDVLVDDDGRELLLTGLVGPPLFSLRDTAENNQVYNVTGVFNKFGTYGIPSISVDSIRPIARPVTLVLDE